MKKTRKDFEKRWAQYMEALWIMAGIREREGELLVEKLSHSSRGNPKKKVRGTDRVTIPKGASCFRIMGGVKGAGK